MNFKPQDYVYHRGKNAFGKTRVLGYGMLVIALAAAWIAILPIAQSKAVIGGPIQTTAPSWIALLA
jgi:hypothetical protein